MAWSARWRDVYGCAEISSWLIPWSVASMKDSAAPTREVALLFDRVIFASTERSAAPPKSYNQARYLSEFRRIQVDQYPASVFHVFPYATAQYDLLERDLLRDEAPHRVTDDVRVTEALRVHEGEHVRREVLGPEAVAGGGRARRGGRHRRGAVTALIEEVLEGYGAEMSRLAKSSEVPF